MHQTSKTYETPPPPHEEDQFNPYELGRAFKGAHQSFRINGISRMDVEIFLEETRRSVANLITKELQDLDSAKVQTTAWIQFKVEVEGGEESIIIVDTVKNVLNSRMMEPFQRSDFGKIIKVIFAHIKTQVQISISIS